MRGLITGRLPLTAVLALVCLLVLPGPEAGAIGSGSFPYAGSGNWRITNDTALAGEYLVVTGNISIESGATLRLVDSTILMNCSSPNQFHVVVKAGGSLEMVSSFILPVNASNGFRLVVERQVVPARLSPEVGFTMGLLVGVGVGFPVGIAATAYAYKRWFSRNLPPPV